jgi:EEF1A N-terminal glycine/lysine methyltransferase
VVPDAQDVSKVILTSDVTLSAGRYTPPHVCDAWLALSHAAGLEWSEETEAGVGPHDTTGAAWLGKMPVTWSGRPLDAEALATRKGMCRLWVGKWRAVP